MIPAEAVEAAYEALPLDSYIAGTDHVRAMLEAAAPFITAAAYEADELAAEYRRGYRDGLTDRKQVTDEVAEATKLMSRNYPDSPPKDRE